MRAQDKVIFLEAARHFQYWILVRRTNPASLQYIGRPGFIPKPIECKAKTADFDVSHFHLAGLVADPTLHPTAFKSGKAQKAKECWSAMKSETGRKFAVDMDTRSKHYGCLQMNGSYIHGDYDLKDFIDMTQPHRNLALVGELHGQPHFSGAQFKRLQQFINSRIGSPMIQHGGEAQYADHSEESIDAFGPHGEDTTILNEYSVRKWYEDRFGGRRTLADRPFA